MSNPSPHRAAILSELREHISRFSKRGGPVYLCDHLVCDLWYDDQRLHQLADHIAIWLSVPVTDGDIEMWKRVSHIHDFVERAIAGNTTVVRMA